MNLTILTGHGNMDRTIEALHCGVDDFIQKPFDAEKPILKMDRFFIKQEAFRKIKIYENFLPICIYCKKIRDDSGTRIGEGKWMCMEEYLCQKSGADLIHGCCPECFATKVND